MRVLTQVCDAIIAKMGLADPLEISHLLDFFLSNKGASLLQQVPSRSFAFLTYPPQEGRL